MFVVIAIASTGGYGVECAWLILAILVDDFSVHIRGYIPGLTTAASARVPAGMVEGNFDFKTTLGRSHPSVVTMKP